METLDMSGDAIIEKPQRADRLLFFRQSGWMMIATVVSGVCFAAVHTLALPLLKSDYVLFATLLQMLNMMVIPTIGVQSVFVQQAAASVTEDQRRQLVGTVRPVLFWSFMIWVGLAAGSLIFRARIFTTLHIEKPVAYWIALGGGLAMLWLPILQGLLQGKQNFLWLGFSAISNGLIRLIGVGIVLTAFHLRIAAATGAVFVGLWFAVGVAGWQNRDLLGVRSLPPDWMAWIKSVIPLTLGLGTTMFMLGADQVFAAISLRSGDLKAYTAAGVFARAMVMFAAPIASVMFPKIVRSAAQSQSSTVVWQGLGFTALLAMGAALACTLAPWLPLKLVYRSESFSQAAEYLPIFVWAMVPLSLANVLMATLLARRQFRVTPWLIVLVGGYVNVLLVSTEARQLITRLAIFNCLYLLLAVFFTWQAQKSALPPVEPA